MPVPGPASGKGSASPGLLAAVLVFLAVESTAVASLGTPLLPTVQQAEHVSLAASQWALTVTLLTGAVATPLMGRLGDGRLRRRTTIGAVAVMLAGCVLSALPAGFAMFLAGRALQGAGLGLVPLATAVARDGLPAQRSRRTIALIGVTTAVGIGVGYPLAGLLAQGLGLYAPFWFVAALSVVALAAAVAVLPESPSRPPRIDAAGAIMLGAGIAGLLLVLTEGPARGWASAATLASGVISAALLAAWAVWELRARHPLIELRLLRPRPVLAANLSVFLIAVGSVYAVNPLQITGGVPAAETGSAISFYQLNRTVAYSIASALSATILILGTPAGHAVPASAAYSAAALASTAVLVAALVVSSIFAVAAQRPEIASAPTTGADSATAPN